MLDERSLDLDPAFGVGRTTTPPFALVSELDSLLHLYKLRSTRTLVS
jgi:hypothetical protein